jgi:hypothetical protein
MTLAKGLAFLGLMLDIFGVVMIGLRSERWMIHYWRGAPAQFDTRKHKVMYHVAWWTIIAGFIFQAAAVLVQ